MVGSSFDVAAGVEPELDESLLHADNMARRIHAAWCRKKRVFMKRGPCVRRVTSKRVKKAGAICLRRATLVEKIV